MFDNNHKCPIGHISILMSIYYDRLLTYHFLASTLNVCKLYFLIDCNSCFFICLLNQFETDAVSTITRYIHNNMSKKMFLCLLTDGQTLKKTMTQAIVPVQLCSIQYFYMML